MKVEFSSDANAEAGGVEVADMGIDVSKGAKLFTILSQGLYSDEAMSVIRELCSNAADAHTMANNSDEGFIVTVPTWAYPWFEVRDYGIGLTAVEARKTILSFLGSAKDTSDDVIGGWGLGSKSPFAYTTSYEIHCIKDGVKAVFNCWKDNNGIPKNALFEEVETHEANGVLVRVPVEKHDIGMFEKKVLKYLSKTDFRCWVGNPSDNHPAPRSKLVLSLQQDEFSWQLRRTEGEFAGSAYVLYGGFTYPVAGLPGLEEATTKILAGMTEATQYDLVLKVDVGACDFSVSRESLRGTERTVSFLNRAVQALFAHIDGKVIQHQRAVLAPVAKMIAECKASKTPINLAMLQDASTESSDPIFKFVSFRTYMDQMRKLRGGTTTAAPDGDLLNAINANGTAEDRADAEKQVLGLLSVKVDLDTTVVCKDSEGKRWSSMKNIRRASFEGSYSKDTVHLSASAVASINVDALTPIDQQYKFLWTPYRMAKKFIKANDYHTQKYTHLIVECPTEAEAIDLLGKAGILGIDVQPLGNYITYEKVAGKGGSGEKRDGTVIPKYIQDYTNNKRFDYDEDQEYYYFESTKSISWEHRNSLEAVLGKKIFCASPNFLTKTIRNLDNVNPLSDITIEDFPEDMLEQVQLLRDRAAWDQELADFPYHFKDMFFSDVPGAQDKKTKLLNLFMGMGLDLRPILRDRKRVRKDQKGREVSWNANKHYSNVLEYFKLDGGRDIVGKSPAVCNCKVLIGTMNWMLTKTALRYVNWEQILRGLNSDYAAVSALLSQFNAFEEPENVCQATRF